jgi:hypothetical protein
MTVIDPQADFSSMTDITLKTFGAIACCDERTHPGKSG